MNAVQVFSLACLVVIAYAVYLTRTTRAAVTRDDERQQDMTHAINDIANEYSNCIAMDYSARDARAHARAYMHYQYPHYTGDDKRAIMVDAVYQGIYNARVMKHGAPLKDINPIPN